ncbi:MAG: hypothetical protein LBH97_00555 [Treponema sp.]|nr:hypothetical protein [Treponema sp.]
MKRMYLCRLIIVAGIMVLAACGTSSSDSNRMENSNAILMWQSEVEGYILSNHDTNNNLVYFFIKNDNRNENAYAFIITEQMDKSEGMQCLVNYSMAGDIPGIRTTEASAAWYNEYSPVVIQDDYRAISLAAFSLPKEIKNVWILVQNITMNNNQANNKAYPFMDFSLGEESIQYYLINAGAGTVNNVMNSVDRTEFEKLLERTTNYATQVGKRFQLGYISGKGQKLQPME